jgi:hypothetical protein
LYRYDSDGVIRLIDEINTPVGLYKLHPVQWTHSLKAPGFNP